jgi:hypothetical protein
LVAIAGTEYHEADRQSGTEFCNLRRWSSRNGDRFGDRLDGNAGVNEKTT